MNTKMNHKSRLFTLLLALVLALAPAFSLSQPVQAEPISCVVTSNADSGEGTLRAWLADATCSTITFADNYEIHLTSTLVIDSNRTVTIDGVARMVTISGDSNNDGSADIRLFEIASGSNVSLQNLSITKGFNAGTTSGDLGGAIRNNGELSVLNSSITRSSAYVGGGIYNGGTLTVSGSTFTDNSAVGGGAIYNDAYLSHNPNANVTVTGSTFSHSTSTWERPSGGGITVSVGVMGGGAAIANFFGTLEVTGSTFSGNTANYLGGAIASAGGSTVTNSTFNGNAATGMAGAIFTYWGMLTNNTFANNAAPDGSTLVYYDVSANTMTLHNNLLVRGDAGANCGIYHFDGGTLGGIAGASNLADDDSCGSGFTNIPTLSTQIGTLRDNGGSTQTIPLLEGSPAIDTGDDASCPANDQRGVTRPQGAHCDVGAYEYEPPVTYSISGQLFYDDNRNGILDGDEYFTYFGETIQLDQGCDGTVDDSFYLTYYVQTYTFANLPADQSYCVSYYNPGNRTTTPKQVTASLSGDMTGVNVGFAYVYLEAQADTSLNGPVNEAYQRTITVSGGDAPYTFAQTDQALPPGLTGVYNSDGTMIISGTPTQVGEYSFIVETQDSNGADGSDTFLFWIQSETNFTLTSTPNPSSEAEPVTFSLSKDYPEPFIGLVTFYADGAPIEGCAELYFGEMTNEWLDEYIDFNPVECTTGALTPGMHAITADYRAYYGAYLSVSVSLAGGQTVTNYEPMIFSPANLPNGSLGVAYNQTILLSGGIAPYTFRIGGEQWLPSGLTVDTSSGDIVISGTPTEAGQVTLDVYVTDQTGTEIEIQYEFWIKTDPSLTLTSSLKPSLQGQEVTFSLGSTATAPHWLAPWGQVTFYADGAVISGCDGLWLGYNPETEEETSNPATCNTSSLATGLHAITAALTTIDGPYNSATAMLTGGQTVNADVSNTAPLAGPGGPYLGAVNTDIPFDGSGSSDPENDPLTYAWDFGDGGPGNGVMPARSYAATGIYDVCLTVNDDSLNSDPACTIAVVYDPSAGFVTGGGWIISPEGAYMAGPSLTGKATFGFVSKYKKGASVPTGTTAFAFDLAGFEFYSDSYEWLVVNQAGTNAQFKGSGTVNGTLDPNGNAYKFMLWAGDGSPDMFRIRIWWEDSDAVEQDVYDNGFEGSPFENGQPVGAGNIVVHKGK